VCSSDLAPETVSNLQTVKGVGFVAVTGLALFLLIRRELARRMRAERRQQRLVEELKDVLFTISREGRFTALNRAFERLTQFRCSEWIGRPFDEIIHPDDLARVQELFQQALRQEEIPTIEARVKSQSGAYLTAEITVSVEIDQNEVVALVGVARDVTEQRQALERLREKAALLDMASDAILVEDKEHRILYWNRGAERLYGWTREEALGRKITELLLHGQAGHGDPEADAALHTSGVWRGEMRHGTKAGRFVTVESRLNVLRDAEGRPKAVLCVNSDVTEKKRLEQQFLNAQRMESIGKLASGIAHDLNNILAPILIASQTIQENLDDPEIQEFMEIIKQSGRRGAEVVNQILGFVRGVKGERFTIQPKHLVKEVARFARETFPKAITVRVEVHGEPWPMQADPSQIYQLLLNLCINARDAMPRGGTLSLELENVELGTEDVDRLGVAKPGPHVLFRVQDTGIGIPPEIIERIFDPLFTTKASGEGTGLGLATVQMIVKEHGGSCRVESERGKGTGFSVHLPASPGATIQAMSQGPIAAAMGQGELLLVVDDEEAVLSIVVRALEMNKYRVITATNGVEAIAKFVEYRDQIRLLITDLEMPQMGGRTLIMSVRRLSPHLRILIISGSAGACTLHEEIGNADYLPKPFPAAELLNATRRLLDAGGTTFMRSGHAAEAQTGTQTHAS